MSLWIIVASSFCYLLVLFGIAHFAEKKAKQQKSIITPSIYALSLAVYCTAWSYYGSVGRAVRSGIDYALIYLGPSIIAPLWWLVMRKIIRISKVYRLTSIADFLSSRYGKSAQLGGWVALLCVVMITPYIALQLKGISNSLHVLAGTETSGAVPFWSDVLFYIALGLVVFTVLFGVRRLDVSERHEGMIVAIAFESVWKLIAFLAVGLFVTYGLYDGPGSLFEEASRVPELKGLFTITDAHGRSEWFWTLVLSMLAVLLLPRQFQVGVVENVDEKHLDRSVWLFPLYLLLMNLFVLPIAFGGYLQLGDEGLQADTYVLLLPLQTGHEWLALLVYLGGLSAATGMVIVSSTALSVMVSNNLLLPLLLKRGKFNNQGAGATLLYSRWVSILIILMLAYLYYRLIAQHYSLVSIGLISFAGVAQLAPALIGGLFWKDGSKQGALFGLLLGFLLWGYTLVLPSMAEANWLSQEWLGKGPWGIAWLRPTQLFGLTGMSYLSHSLFWSMFFNIGAYALLSLLVKPTSLDKQQALAFVDIFRYSERKEEGGVVWKGSVLLPDVQSVLFRFLGQKRAKQVVLDFQRMYGWKAVQKGKADANLLTFAENALAGVIGTASARILLDSVSKSDAMPLGAVVSILEESQQVMATNKALRETSAELRKVTGELRNANEQLKEQDQVKDEFLYTVTHELRTPLTSIRALAEILYDHQDMEREEQESFLHTIVKEAERLTRLITQVLDLEKFESGKLTLEWEMGNIRQVVEEAAAVFEQQLKQQGIQLRINESGSIADSLFDQDRITQVIVNLLSNAIKAQENGGEIEIWIKPSNTRITISIIDRGKGIDAESLPLIFDKFYQAKNQTRKKPKGSGLGLSITQRIVELHGGEIGVVSEPGEGSTFTWWIPIKREEEQPTSVK